MNEMTDSLYMQGEKGGGVYNQAQPVNGDWRF